ncbi:hypothetical protein R1sor_007184 [Riccia sorocarpa]|uniref:Uncharacterized protein n=1 Tax=Riccia sorocarpa TaxID=122646 RepID=A0ABD3HQ39_9MARC
MFHVERWFGTEGGGRKSVSPLSLDRLNARARERAAALQREKAQGTSPAEALPVPALRKQGDDVPTEDSKSASKTYGTESKPDVDEEKRWLGGEIGSEKKEKKRKTRQQQDEDLPRLNDVEARNSVEKVRKVKRVKVSDVIEEHAPFPEVWKENAGDKSITSKGKGKGASPETPNAVEKVRKKKKGKVSQESEDAMSWRVPELVEQLKTARLSLDGLDGEEDAIPVEAPGSAGKESVKKSKKTAVHESKESKKNRINPELATKASIEKIVPTLVEVTEPNVKKKKKKEKLKKQEFDGTESAGGSELTENDSGKKSIQDRDGAAIANGGNGVKGSRLAEVSASEPDFSAIERDVERILGRDSLAPDEPKDKGPVLPWMRDPLEIDAYEAIPLAQVPALDTRLREALSKLGMKTLFPVQMAVWYETVGPGLCERDVCVSSPTGSGKTLAYALPIVQKLSSRVLRLLRALVVLPTRDLAAQVKAVFDTIAPAVGLSVGLAVGQTSITTEAGELVNFRKTMIHSFGSGYSPDAAFAESNVDILVATPGRLMDHLRNTKGFTLENLQFLVVDETDRLLRQAYQEWLPNVLAAAVPNPPSSGRGLSSRNYVPGMVRTFRRCLHRGRGPAVPRLMKMVLSATLTRDPAKIGQLDLYRPIYVAPGTVGSRYQLPEQLKSFRMVCKAGEKPLYLVALLQQLSNQPTIVFTASVVATHRLYTLLKNFKGLSLKVVEYSSLQHQQARSNSLAKFRNGEAHVLIASDAMTRGMDVEGIANVVNYDMPVYAKTYVHRVGRTARAGQPGSAFTLLRKEEVRHFKLMLQKVNNSRCKDYSMRSSATEELYEAYSEALEKLKQVAEDEAATASNGRRKNDEEQEATGPDELFM